MGNCRATVQLSRNLSATRRQCERTDADSLYSQRNLAGGRSCGHTLAHPLSPAASPAGSRLVHQPRLTWAAGKGSSHTGSTSIAGNTTRGRKRSSMGFLTLMTHTPGGGGRRSLGRVASTLTLVAEQPTFTSQRRPGVSGAPSLLAEMVPETESGAVVRTC